MADTFYDRLQATASRLIAQYGREVILLKRTTSGTAYNPVVTENSHYVYGVQSEYKSHEIDGTLIQRNDKKFLVYSSLVVPDTKDALQDGTKKYSIIDVKEIKPGTTNIFYEIQARL